MAHLTKSLRERATRLRARAEERPEPVATAGPPHADAARLAGTPAAEVPWTVRVVAEWSWRSLCIVAAAAMVVLAVIRLRSVVIPVLLAVVVAVLLSPAFELLHRRLRIPRVLAALVVVLAFIAVIASAVSFAGQSLVNGFTDLWDRAADGLESLLVWLSDGPFQLSREQVIDWWGSVVSTIQSNTSVLANGALSVTSSIGNILAGVALVLFLTLFFLMNGRRIWVWVVRLLPRAWRHNVHEASIRGYVTLRGYVKSTIAVALIDAIGIGGGAALLGLPLALPIGVLVFLGSFVPIVGATLTGAVACLVALVDKGMGYAIGMLVIVLVVQQVEANVLQPLIMGSSVQIHTAAVVLGVAGGTYLAGITGAVFAVPVIAFLNSFALYLAGHDRYPHLGLSATRPGGPPGTLGQQIGASYGYGVAVADGAPVPVPEEAAAPPANGQGGSVQA